MRIHTNETPTDKSVVTFRSQPVASGTVFKIKAGLNCESVVRRENRFGCEIPRLVRRQQIRDPMNSRKGALMP